MELTLARYIVIGTIIIYFIFNYFDEKAIKDEREELIRLKTFELMQKLTMAVLVVIAMLLIFLPSMAAIYPVLAVVASCMYGEIFGKIYYRRKF